MKSPFIRLPFSVLGAESFLSLVQEELSVFVNIDFPLDAVFTSYLLDLQTHVQSFENILAQWSMFETQFSLQAFESLEQALIFLLHKIQHHQYSADLDQKNAYYHLFLLWQQHQKEFAAEAWCGQISLKVFLEKLYEEKNRSFLHILDLEGAILDLDKKYQSVFGAKLLSLQQKMNPMIDDFWKKKKNLKMAHQRFLDHLYFLTEKEPTLYLSYWEFCLDKKQISTERWLLKNRFFVTPS